MKTFVTLLTLFVADMALAAGGAAHGSVTDLVYPAVNFFALFFFLIFMLKKPLREMFDKKADDVTNLYEFADKRDKEAKIKLEMFQKKMNNLESEKNKIEKNAEKEAKEFVTRAQQESEEYLKRLDRDSESKINHERTSLENQLKEDLVSEVIEKAKNKISNDKELNKKATSKLISEI